MPSLINKLIKYLPRSVFSQSPDPAIAMRIRASASLTWEVGAKTLTVVANGQNYSYSLTNKTLAELSSELEGSGITIEYLNPDQAGRGAICLIEGSGDQDTSNGDHLLAHRNLVWSLFGAYAEELIESKEQQAEALKQMVIPDSEAEWLDLWGDIYGIPRQTGETDAVFAPRIPVEVFRERVNPRAIELAIRDLTGRDVRIEEPWQRIARWDESITDGPDKFYDGERIGYHLIQPTTRDYVDWNDILPIVHRNRPTGVLVLPPVTNLLFDVDATGHEALFGMSRRICAETPLEDKLLWDYAYFGDRPVLNQPMHHTRQRITFAESAYDDSTWNVEIIVVRNFRVTFMSSTYMRQTWDSGKTWTGANASWRNFNEVEPMRIDRLS